MLQKPIRALTYQFAQHHTSSKADFDLSIVTVCCRLTACMEVNVAHFLHSLSCATSKLSIGSFAKHAHTFPQLIILRCCVSNNLHTSLLLAQTRPTGQDQTSAHTAAMSSDGTSNPSHARRWSSIVREAMASMQASTSPGVTVQAGKSEQATVSRKTVSAR